RPDRACPYRPSRIRCQRAAGRRSGQSGAVLRSALSQSPRAGGRRIAGRGERGAAEGILQGSARLSVLLQGVTMNKWMLSLLALLVSPLEAGEQEVFLVASVQLGGSNLAQSIFLHEPQITTLEDCQE